MDEHVKISVSITTPEAAALSHLLGKFIEDYGRADGMLTSLWRPLHDKIDDAFRKASKLEARRTKMAVRR